MDTQNGHILRGVHIFQTIIVDIHVSFSGDVMKGNGPTPLIIDSTMGLRKPRAGKGYFLLPFI